MRKYLKERNIQYLILNYSNANELQLKIFVDAVKWSLGFFVFVWYLLVLGETSFVEMVSLFSEIWWSDVEL